MVVLERGTRTITTVAAVAIIEDNPLIQEVMKTMDHHPSLVLLVDGHL